MTITINMEHKFTALELLDTVKDLGDDRALSIQPAEGFSVNIKREDNNFLVECTNHYLYERGVEVLIPLERLDTELIKAIESAYAN